MNVVRVMPIVGIVAATVACAARSPRAPSGVVERPPAGLDSTALATWVDQRRRDCRGSLSVLYDEGMIADSGGRVYRHHVEIASVSCQPAAKR